MAPGHGGADHSQHRRAQGKAEDTQHPLKDQRLVELTSGQHSVQLDGKRDDDCNCRGHGATHNRSRAAKASSAISDDS